MSGETIQLTDTLWVFPSRAMHYNAGVFLSGNRACLIDPGVHPDETGHIAWFVAEHGATIDTILLTHSHWDHILGPERLPPARIAAHTAYRELTERFSARILHMVSYWEHQSGYQRESPFVIPQPDLEVEDGDEIAVGADHLRLLHIPGHAADQCAVYDPKSGTLWAADTLSNLEIPFVSHSLADYEASLAKLSGLSIQALVPGHGSSTSSQSEITERIDADRAYLAELRERVAGVVAAGGSIEEALAHCASLVYREPESNAGPHRLNVESVYIELGGRADPDLAGWGRKDLIDM